MALTGKQRRYLRGLGHGLPVLVQIGKPGLDPTLVAAVDRALLDHELVKIRVGQGAALGRYDAADALAAATTAEVAQVLGNTMLLYRRRPDDEASEATGAKKRKPSIALPGPAATDGDDDDDAE